MLIGPGRDVSRVKKTSDLLCSTTDIGSSQPKPSVEHWYWLLSSVTCLQLRKSENKRVPPKHLPTVNMLFQNQNLCTSHFSRHTSHHSISSTFHSILIFLRHFISHPPLFFQLHSPTLDTLDFDYNQQQQQKHIDCLSSPLSFPRKYCLYVCFATKIVVELCVCLWFVLE